MYIKRAGLALLGFLVLLFILGLLFPLPDHLEYSTIITDNRGECIHAYLTRDQQYRMRTELDEISPLLRKIIVEKEDKYFYYHPGVNLLAIGRALVRNILKAHRTSGASTITMQVARALEPGKRTYWRKTVEIFRAFQLEWKYSKDQILQLYLNLVPYGGNIEGVKSASVLYFRKNPDHLSLAEITALAIIPNRPGSLRIGINNDQIVQERNKWLRRFAREKIFSEKEIRDALEEPLNAHRNPAPHLVPQFAYKLRKKGLNAIHSFIDLNMQLKLEKLVADYSRSLYFRNIHNAALIVIDNNTHQVVTYIGSSDFSDTLAAGQVNGAAAIRQPGSTLKPLLYGLCIDQGLLTPKMVITDVAVNFSGYAPENYDRKFNGYVTMEYALSHSLNIPAVKSLNALGKDKLIQELSVCGFNQIRKDQRKLGLSMILGGCGANLEELTGMYSLFVNNGRFVKPVWDATDTVRSPADRLGTKIISPAACFMINQILSSVNRPDFPLNWESTVHLPKIAWKTGTSYGRRDAWSIGYNKHFTVGVWLGNFSAAGVPELNGANTATPLLFNVFNSIDYNSEGEWFQQPEDCDIRKVCPETGLPPGDHCPDPITDYFIPLVSPARKCDNYQEIMISENEKISYCRTCMPKNGFKKKWYKIISPQMQQYFEVNHIAYEKIPPHNPACERLFKEGGPSITSPAPEREYMISSKNPEPLQLTCHVGNDVTKVFWYINDKFYKTANPGEKQFFVPAEGPVKISCTDDKGRNRNIWITVKYVDL